MSSGAGHIMDMIQTLKNNKRKRKSIFEKEYGETIGSYGQLIDHKKMSSEELVAFRLQIKAQKRKELKRFLIVFTSIMLIIIGIFAYLFFLQ